MRAGSPLCEAATGMLSVLKAPLSKLTWVSQHSSPQVVQAVTCFLGLSFTSSVLTAAIKLSFQTMRISYRTMKISHGGKEKDLIVQEWGDIFFSPEHTNSISEKNESQTISTWGNIWEVRTKGLLNDSQSFYQPMTVAECFCCKTVVWHMPVKLPERISHLNKTEKTGVPVQYTPDFS